MSRFSSLELLPIDPILGLLASFRNDPRTHKINLGVGIYQNSEGKTEVLESVLQAEKVIFEKKLGKEYLPITGSPPYIKAIKELIFGEEERPIVGVQTLGGTGALRIGGEFLKRTNLSSKVYFSDPTWPNHKPILLRAGMEEGSYAYFNKEKQSLDFTGMVRDLESCPPSSTILLQPCCHNPTGIDLTFEQWETLSALMLRKKLIPFFDLAYLGFAAGVNEDSRPIRYFMEKGHEMLVAFSCSKNFGLYGERVGFLGVVLNGKENMEKVNSHLSQIIRGNYSMPPLHGQAIVTEILTSPNLRKMWEEEASRMRERMGKMRHAITAKLNDPRFSFLDKQKGMFSMLGLSSEQIDHLKSEYAIFMPANSRINVAGLNEGNLEYVSKALLGVLNETK